MTISQGTSQSIVYKSNLRNIDIPKHSVFEHIFPSSNDPHIARLDLPALVDGITGETLTRRSLSRHSLVLAAAMLHQLGLKRGQVVMLLSPNSIQYPIVLLAAVAAGLKVTFANPAYTASELAHQLQDSNAACVFVHSTVLRTLEHALPSDFDAKHRVVLTQQATDIAPSILSEGWLLLDDLLSGTRLLEPIRVEGEEAVRTSVFLYYSSGTTGKSKGVETTHHNMVSAFEMTTHNWHAIESQRDIMLAVIPWYHITGGCATLMYAIHMAIPIIVLPRFEPNTFLSAIEKYKPTVTVIAPPILLFFLNTPLLDRYDVRSFRTILSGSAPASQSLVEGAASRLNQRGASVTIGQAYGLTETSPGTHIVPPEWTTRKSGTVGRLMPNMEARLVDDSGRDVPKGSQGELWVKGPNVMKGYLNNPEATRNTITQDGWLKTGDIAVIDEDGFCQIVDRKKELIKVKGFQVPPAELEALLLQNPNVLDAGVIGVFSSEQQTEFPRAYVVPRDERLLVTSNSARVQFSADVQQWVKQRVVHYKQLRAGVIIVPSIPRSAAGKILRRELRNLASDGIIGAKL